MINKKQFLLGFFALSAGALEYLLHRSLDATYLGRVLQETLGTLPVQANVFGPLAGLAPEFFHPLAFCLVTMSIIPGAGDSWRAGICLFWLTIELFFEIGQNFGAQLSMCVRNVNPCEPLSAVGAYFSGGTYDPLDVLAICFGISTAYIVGKMTSIQRLQLKEA